MIRVSVTPICAHEDGFTDSGATVEGSSLVVNENGVWVDGDTVLIRDRRMIKNRTPGHPWMNVQLTQSWTGITVECREINARVRGVE